MGITLVACQKGAPDSEKQSKSSEQDEQEKVIINVETAKTYLGESIATLKSTAILEADRAATITTKSSGIILDILVEEGDLVEKDQVLLVLESDEQKLTLQSATANYAKSLNNFERAQKLQAKGLVNEEQIDNLKFETRSLKATLDQAAMNLSFTQVKSPFAGTVVKRHVKIGNLVQNATAVFEVIDFDSLQAKIDVPEHQWRIMKPGLPVQFQFDALESQFVTGEVIRVSPVIDSASGTFEITVQVDNSEKLLRPGLFAKAQIVYDQKDDVVLVDKNSIIREDELAYVYLLEGENEVKKIKVSLGYEMSDAYEITNGLMNEQVVITTGKNNLTPDVLVNVVNYDESL
jgi:membrane fusion protein (multidrug efflux system)